MIIHKIRLANFRNFKERLLNFSSGTSVIIGPNASGKTNVLEAVYLLSFGKSFRAKIEEEMINHANDLSRISGLFVGVSRDLKEKKDSVVKAEVVLTRGEITIGDEKTQKAPRKKLLINGVSRRLFNFAGSFRVVLFGPQDLELVTESPSIRRKFMDSVLIQVDREYRRALFSYEKGIKQRNRLLFRIREEGVSRSQLMFWDRLLIKNGNYVSVKRKEYIDFVNTTSDFNEEDFSLEYEMSAISETRLDQYKEEEVAAATTLVGPHRDDFCFKLKVGSGKRSKARNLAKYGSRGEQRMGVLWIKLAELKFIKEITGEKPTLLLDDIFSELDSRHRKIVMDVVKDQQTIITTTDTHFIRGFEGGVRIDLGN